MLAVRANVALYCLFKNVSKNQLIRRNIYTLVTRKCPLEWVPLTTYIFNSNIKWRIQDFPEESANPQSGCVNLLFCKFLAENCIKMKEF